MGTARCLLAMMVAWLLLTGVCLGKQVYMRDGAVIACESFWRRGDQVMVKVNRDILLEFDTAEVDTGKTFRTVKKKPVHRHSRKSTVGEQIAKAAAAPPGGQSVPEKRERPVDPPPVQPASAKTPANAPPPPVAKVATPAPVPAPAAPHVATPEPTQPVAAEASAPPDKAELQRRSKEAAEMMAEALKKNDPELMKKAIAAQKSVIDAQKGAMQAGKQGASPVQQAQARTMGMKFLLIMLVSLLLMVISTWVVFQKAGQPGWHSIIPIYNMYVMMEIAGKPWWWMLLLFVPIVGAVIYLLAMIALAQKFGRSLLYGLGLFFLPMFFFPMLAFGGAQYEGETMVPTSVLLDDESLEVR